jgi:hypothetical protein
MSGVWFKVTTSPLPKAEVQVPGHEMLPLPPEDVTVPEPVIVTDSIPGSCVKVAVQERGADIVTEASPQSPSPVQPANVQPEAGLLVSPTTSPNVKSPVQVPDEHGTLPLPPLVPTEPIPTTVRLRFGRKAMLQVRAADIVTEPSVQSASPVKPPDVQPGSTIAVSPTTVLTV